MSSKISGRSRSHPSAAERGPLDPYLDGFLQSVSSVGYSRASLRDIRQGVLHFERFLAAKGVTGARDLRQAHLDQFITTQPLYRCRGKYLVRISRGIRAAKHLMRYLRTIGVVPPAPVPPVPIYSPLLQEWLTFLRHHRGLAPKSLNLYERHVSRFLDTLGADATTSRLWLVTPEQVRRYVLGRSKLLSRSERKALVSTLRIFLRFAHHRGYLPRDLTVAVERVPSYKDERLPRGPRWQDVLRLPETADRRSAQGCRDFAILLILLHYGVRANQVARLRLDDLDWRGGRIRFPSCKGGRPIEVPLLPAVGQAAVEYLRGGRPASASRFLFLSTDPPFGPLASSSMYNIVSRAFRLAGVQSPHQGSHAIRHAWATRMLAQGRPLKAIADLLGHRRIETTRIYAKVDLRRLREVALPWPQEVSR